MATKSIKKVAALVGLLGMMAGQMVWAALPTSVAPSTAPAAGDWIELIKGYINLESSVELRVILPSP